MLHVDENRFVIGADYHNKPAVDYPLDPVYLQTDRRLIPIWSLPSKQPLERQQAHKFNAHNHNNFGSAVLALTVFSISAHNHPKS